jgi:hypothetical protein
VTDFVVLVEVNIGSQPVQWPCLMLWEHSFNLSLSFESDVRVLSASYSAFYAPEENVVKTCWIEGLHLVKK